MKIAVTATGDGLEAEIDPRFGRCQKFVFVDTDTLETETIDNQNVTAGGGAGVQSAQLVANSGADTVLTGNCGPNAHQTLAAAGVTVIVGVRGTVRDAVERFKAGELSATNEPNVDTKFGV